MGAQWHASCRLVHARTPRTNTNVRPWVHQTIPTIPTVHPPPSPPRKENGSSRSSCVLRQSPLSLSSDFSATPTLYTSLLFFVKPEPAATPPSATLRTHQTYLTLPNLRTGKASLPSASVRKPWSTSSLPSSTSLSPMCLAGWPSSQRVPSGSGSMSGRWVSSPITPCSWRNCWISNVLPLTPPLPCKTWTQRNEAPLTGMCY